MSKAKSSTVNTGIPAPPAKRYPRVFHPRSLTVTCADRIVREPGGVAEWADGSTQPFISKHETDEWLEQSGIFIETFDHHPEVTATTPAPQPGFPRTFEWHAPETSCHGERLTFNTPDEKHRCLTGMLWSLADILKNCPRPGSPHGWREVTPAPQPEQPPFAPGDRVRSNTGLVVTVEMCLKSNHFKTWMVCYDGDGTMDAADCTLVPPEPVEVTPSEHRYASGEIPQVGDVVEGVGAFADDNQKEGWSNDGTVLRSEFGFLEVHDGDGQPRNRPASNYRLVRRAGPPEPVEANAELTALREKMAEVERERDEAKAALDGLRFNDVEKSQRIAALGRTCDEQSSSLSDLRREVLGLRETLSARAAEIHAALKRAEAAEGERDGHAAEWNACHAILDKLKAEFPSGWWHGSIEEAVKVRNERDDLTAQLTAANAKIARLRGVLERVEIRNYNNGAACSFSIDGIWSALTFTAYATGKLLTWKAAGDAALADAGDSPSEHPRLQRFGDLLMTAMRRLEREGSTDSLQLAELIARELGVKSQIAHELSELKPTTQGT